VSEEAEGEERERRDEKRREERERGGGLFIGLD